MEEDTGNIRQQLIKLAKNKDIPYSQVKIKKMDFTELEQVWNEHKAKELDNINETFADIIIVKFDELMKNYNWVKPNSKLAQKLQDRKLFKNDVKTVVSYFTPLLPFLGLVEGGAVVVSEVMDNYSDSNKNNNDKHDSCETSQGSEQNTTTTEPTQHESNDEN